MRNRTAKIMKSIDIFGDSINFSAKDGERSYKTCVGAFVTLLLFILLSLYSTKRFIIMINRDDTKYGASTSFNTHAFED